jgi:CRISPR-associated protein Cas2
MTAARVIVAYDIANPKRLRQVCRIVSSFGRRLQFSVFECNLTNVKKEKLKFELNSVINHLEDQVLFITLNHRESPSSPIIEAIGISYKKGSTLTII